MDVISLNYGNRVEIKVKQEEVNGAGLMTVGDVGTLIPSLCLLCVLTQECSLSRPCIILLTVTA